MLGNKVKDINLSDGIPVYPPPYVNCCMYEMSFVKERRAHHINKPHPSGYLGIFPTLLSNRTYTAARNRNSLMRQNQIQHMKLHHFSYTTLLKLQHIKYIQ